MVSAAQAELHGFVTARGDELYIGDKPFRFISFNIPNLQLVEDNFAPDAKTAWAWPNEFELNDALASIRQMGGTVARTYVLSVRREGSDMADHVYVRGPGDFNEEAFRSLDLALEAANKQGVRLIIPLVDNWKWQGGIAEYAAFRGKPAEAFWTDEQVIADFEATIRHVLNRVNARTGVAYRDDPAILGWETGNELDAPPEWTSRIAKLIKSLDPNHLVIDGYSLHGVREESLADPNVDVVTTHHYPNVGKGEYIAPNRDGGFYWHSEPAGEGLYKAYHWPGFASGDKYGEREVLRLTREKAYEIRGEEAPPLEIPAPPRLLPIGDPSAISWQGSAGASSYLVERATGSQGPWTVVADAVDDTAVQYRPLFNDATAESRQNYFYRVTAQNEAGKSAASNVVGPVAAMRRTLVDECRDLSHVAETIGSVEPTTGDDRRRREDLHRISIPAGGAVIYRVDAPIGSVEATFFIHESAASDANLFEAAISHDGVNYAPLTIEAQLVDGTEVDKDYGYLPRLAISSDAVPDESVFLKLTPRRAGELAHVTIRGKGNSATGERRRDSSVKKHGAK